LGLRPRRFGGQRLSASERNTPRALDLDGGGGPCCEPPVALIWHPVSRVAKAIVPPVHARWRQAAGNDLL